MNRKDKTGMGVPTQCCRDSTEALEEQILRAVGNLREQPLLPPTAPSSPGISSACAICSLGSHPRHSQALSQEPWVQVRAFPPQPRRVRECLEGRRVGWLTFCLLFRF